MYLMVAILISILLTFCLEGHGHLFLGNTREVTYCLQQSRKYNMPV